MCVHASHVLHRVTLVSLPLQEIYDTVGYTPVHLEKLASRSSHLLSSSSARFSRGPSRTPSRLQPTPVVSPPTRTHAYVQYMYSKPLLHVHIHTYVLYMHLRRYVCTYFMYVTYTCTCTMYVRMYVCTPMYVHVHVQCMYMHLRVYVHVCMCVCVYVCVMDADTSSY